MASTHDVNMTLDNSLISLGQVERNFRNRDNNTNNSFLYGSFSTTDSAPSDWAANAIEEADLASQETEKPPTADWTLKDRLEREPEKPPSPMETSNPAAAVFGAQPGKPVQYLPTVDAYDAWSSVYDSDGNMLQSVDDDELLSMLPDFFARVQTAHSGSGSSTLRIIDFGCGTGRNTARVLGHSWTEDLSVQVFGIDASRGMLERAAEKLGTFIKRDNLSSIAAVVTEGEGKQQGGGGSGADIPQDASTTTTKAPVSLELLKLDFMQDPELPPSLTAQPADAIVSTLVMEHFPLSTYFEALAKLLRPGGLALVTNMHPEMGRTSQAGFEDTYPSGEAVKIRGDSWVHGVQDTVEAAKRAGFRLADDKVTERGVTEDMLGGVVGERGRKWVGTQVWFGMVLRKSD